MSLSSPLSTGDSWRSGSMSWRNERQFKFDDRDIWRLGLTSMSTCTTPVDLRFGRLRLWIMACVVGPLRLSFSFSFSAVMDSSVNRSDCTSINKLSQLTFIVVGPVRGHVRIFLGGNVLGWVLSSRGGWYIRGFEWILSSSVRWRCRLLRVARRIFKLELENLIVLVYNIERVYEHIYK